MPQEPIPIFNFQTPDGKPVAFGTVQIRLSSNGNASNIQLRNNFITLHLDIDGNILEAPLFWTNGTILPLGTYYIIQVFTQTGQLVYGPAKLIL